MKKISTQNLELLPNPEQLQAICKSIATLEAIICPKWEYRYFTYNKNWDKNEECSLMRNGSGDEMLILFSETGTIINGLAHESPMTGQKNIVENVPSDFHTFIYGEPIKSIGTSFCIWNLKPEGKWTISEDITFPNNPYGDGSEELLHFFDGKPETFHQWAAEYYEVADLNIEAIKKVYSNTIINERIVKSLNPALESFEELKIELSEIGFPHKL